MVDLTKDKLQFCLYTIKWATTVELLLENHLSELLSLSKYMGNEKEFERVQHETFFCRDCILSHCKELAGYASEAITGGGCGDPQSWQDLFNIANELHDFLLPLTEAKDYTKEVFDRVADFDYRLRQIRKKLEETGVKFATSNKNTSLSDEEHVT